VLYNTWQHITVIYNIVTFILTLIR
jgi:hypothetical protein